MTLQKVCLPGYHLVFILVRYIVKKVFFAEQIFHRPIEEK